VPRIGAFVLVATTDIHILLSHFDSRSNVINHYAQVVRLPLIAGRGTFRSQLSQSMKFQYRELSLAKGCWT